MGKSQINANVRIVGKYTISLILICTGYFMPAIRDGIQFQKYYFVLAISCQHLGEEYNLEGFCAPLRAQGLEIYNFNNIIFLLDI